MSARTGSGRLFLGACLLVLAGGCADSSGKGNSDTAVEVTVMDEVAGEVTDGCEASLSGFSDGTWELSVDRAWNGSAGAAQFPTDELSEDDYEPVSDGPVLTIEVFDDGAKVAIGTDSIEGTLAAATTERTEYNLSKGTFAGGRFVVWEIGSGLQAELTIYGSGVPIVSSERGPLCVP